MPISLLLQQMDNHFANFDTLQFLLASLGGPLAGPASPVSDKMTAKKRRLQMVRVLSGSPGINTDPPPHY